MSAVRPAPASQATPPAAVPAAVTASSSDAARRASHARAPRATVTLILPASTLWTAKTAAEGLQITGPWTVFPGIWPVARCPNEYAHRCHGSPATRRRAADGGAPPLLPRRHLERRHS